MSKHGHRRIYLALAALVLLACWLLTPGSNEPRANNTPLHVWVDGLIPVISVQPSTPAATGSKTGFWATHTAAYFIPEDSRGTKALIQCGTNALPYLVEWLQYEPPAWKRAAVRVVYNVPFIPRIS